MKLGDQEERDRRSQMTGNNHEKERSETDWCVLWVCALLCDFYRYFKAIAKDEAKQLALLAATECFVGVTHKEYAKETPLVFKVLYDADAAEEEAVIKWFNNPKQAAGLGVGDTVAAAVRKHATPFVKWLEEAESEEESSDEDSD